MNNILTYRAWRPWADVTIFSRRFAAICVRHLQEWSFRHSSTARENESDSNAIDAVFFLLPPRRWVTAAGGLSSLQQLPCCSGGRGQDSKSVDVVLKVCLLLPSRWATAVVLSSVAGAVFSERALYRGQSVQSNNLWNHWHMGKRNKYISDHIKI